MGNIYRFFTDAPICNNKLVISDENVHHIKNVLRMKEQEKLICVNSKKEYTVSISNIEKDKIYFNVEDVVDSNSENQFDVVLFQATPKGDKTDFIIEKATEVGAVEINIVNTKRSVAKISKENMSKKLERYGKIAQSAACQSGRLIIPKVNCFLDLKEIDFSDFDLLIMCYEDEKVQTLKEVLNLHNNKKKIGIFIGPEGGIDSDEVEFLKSKGFLSVSLGNRILRCETAGLYTIANINYALND